MKRFFIKLIIAFSAIAAYSCNRASELPPMNEGYATEFILPDPVNLTQEERDEIKKMEEEYFSSTNQNK